MKVGVRRDLPLDYKGINIDDDPVALVAVNPDQQVDEPGTDVVARAFPYMHALRPIRPILSKRDQVALDAFPALVLPRDRCVAKTKAGTSDCRFRPNRCFDVGSTGTGGLFAKCEITG